MSRDVPPQQVFPQIPLCGPGCSWKRLSEGNKGAPAELCGKCQALLSFIHNSNSHIPAAVPMNIPCKIWPGSRTPPVEMLQSGRSVAVAAGCVASFGKLNTVSALPKGWRFIPACPVG